MIGLCKKLNIIYNIITWIRPKQTGEIWIVFRKTGSFRQYISISLASVHFM